MSPPPAKAWGLHTEDFMKKRKQRKKELFRGDSEARFNAYIGLMELGVEDKTILRYLSMNARMLGKWRCDPSYQQIVAERVEQYRRKFANASDTAKLKKLKVDCGIRNLLQKQDIRFMRNLSVFLNAHENEESTHGLETVEKAIKEAAENVNLDATDFRNALIERLRASDKKQP